MQDVSSSFCLMDTATFFSELFPPLNRALSSFANQVMRFDQTPSDTAMRASLVAGAADILSKTYAVCSLPPRDDGEGGAAAFVAGVRGLIDALGGSGDPTAQRCAKDLQTHTDYVGDKVSDRNGPLDELEAVYFRDFAVTVVAISCNAIFSRYRWKSADPRQATAFFDADAAEAGMSPRSKTVIEAAAAQLEGWCSRTKAAMLFALVREHKPTVAVEIGIYGGRSIVPIALALQENRAGTVTGIETWTAAGSTRFRTNIANDFHWSITDYSVIKRNFFRFALEHNLLDAIRVVEASSDRASALVDDIDFIHIDGGHSAFGAAQDVVTYVSKVRTGGIVVFDDIDWETTGPAVEVLRDSCQLLHVVPSLGQTNVPGCAAFRKL